MFKKIFIRIGVFALVLVVGIGIAYTTTNPEKVHGAATRSLASNAPFAFEVPSDGSIATIQVEPGLYRVYSSGTYRYDHEDQAYAIADAEWMLSTDYNWYEYPPLDPSQKICDLTINGTFFDWRGLQPDGQWVAHSFSSSHEYMVELYLNGNTDFQIYDPWYSDDNSGSLKVIVAPVPEPTFNITGRVTLSNFIGNITSVPISVELRKHGGDITASTVMLQSDGSFTLTGVSIGVYDIAFKASHWLQTGVENVTVSSDISGVDVSLTNGDVNGDNVINLKDAKILKKANGSNSRSKKWNPNADLNGDNKVNRLDMQILKRNLGSVGYK